MAPHAPMGVLNFNSHAHVERDCNDRCYRNGNHHFNSHAHVERDQHIRNVYLLLCYFNSHAHVERDWKTMKISAVFGISTHTLTWSVTRLNK